MGGRRALARLHNNAAGEVSPPCRSLIDPGQAPAIGLRAAGHGVFILTQTSFRKENSMSFSSWLRMRNWSGSGPGSRARGAPRKRAVWRPRLEALEDRALPSVLTVLNNLDSGPNSLRGEIAAASSGDEIVFAKSVHAITLTSGEL